MSEHERKLNVFGQWYEIYKTLKTMDKNSFEYYELSKKCDELKQTFNAMFE